MKKLKAFAVGLTFSGFLHAFASITPELMLATAGLTMFAGAIMLVTAYFCEMDMDA